LRKRVESHEEHAVSNDGSISMLIVVIMTTVSDHHDARHSTVALTLGPTSQDL
jgi:hypothetical protein